MNITEVGLRRETSLRTANRAVLLAGLLVAVLHVGRGFSVPNAEAARLRGYRGPELFRVQFHQDS